MKRSLPLLLGLFTSLGLFAQPANDDCTNAMIIMDGVNQPFTTIDATTDGNDHANDCVSGGNSTTPATTFNDVWYLYTPTYTGMADWSFCNTANFDTKIYVYDGSAACPPVDADIVACNEDFGNCGTTSRILFDVTMGSSYLLRVGGYGDGEPGESGEGSFNLGEFVPMGPANDFCDNAQVVMLGTDQPVDNVGAITDGPEHPNNPCFGFGDNSVMADVWYSFTSPFTGSVEWSTCDMVDFDSRMAIYVAGATCPVTDGDLHACNDDGGGCMNFTSKVIFDVVENETYLLRLGGYSGETGTGAMNLIEIIPPEPPVNDLCSSPTDVFIMSADDADDLTYFFDGTTIGSDFDNSAFIFPNCITNTNGGEFGDVWYRFNTLANTEIEVRFNITDPVLDAEFYFDLWDDCDSLATDPSIMEDCFYFDGTSGNTYFIDTLTGLPDTDTEYLIRVITRYTSDLPGNFWFQLVGENLPIAVEELALDELRFFPNPASQIATLQFNLLETGNVDFDVSNVLGQKIIQQRKGHLAPGNHRFPVDVSNLDPGIYILSVRMDDRVKSLKFVKE